MSEPESHEISRLIASLSDGTLEPEGARRLTDLLRKDPAAQEAYLDHLAMDALLEREFGGFMPAILPGGALAGNPRSVGNRRWVGWGQMAAGLVLGAFLTSAVWAYAVPLITAAAVKLLPLANADFEDGTAPLTTGVPRETGAWSGDFTAVIGASGAVSPFSGKRMLSFLRADNAQSSGNTKSRAAEVWQILDLRNARTRGETGAVTVQLGAWFNAGSHGDKRYTCGVALVACRGTASEIPGIWSQRHDLALAEAEREERLDNDPATWQRVETQVTIPPDADLLLVQVRVYDKSSGATDATSVFPANFVDAVELRVVAPPRKTFAKAASLR